MQYTVKYWYSDLSHITGLKSNQVIKDKFLLKLIQSTKVNVMIQHLMEQEEYFQEKKLKSK
jgi:hypothetical protein